MKYMVTQPVENQPHYLRGFANDGNGEWVERLLDAGVDVNDKDEYGMTALHLASAQNNLGVVEILLDRNADVSAVNTNCQTPLHLATAKGHLGIVRRLLQRCSKDVIDQKAKDSGHAALHYASRHGHVDICRLLLESGAQKHIPDSVRLPPVKYAKNEETRKVFEEQIVAPTPTTESPPKRQPTVEVPPQPVPTALRESRRAETKEVAAPRVGRSKSSDPPRKPRSQDPSSQRLQRKPTRDSVNGAATNHGKGQLQRNDVSIYDESINRKKDEVGPVIVGKKEELDAKKLTDHKITFSDAHKKRMQMSVFDRLAGGSRKK